MYEDKEDQVSCRECQRGNSSDTNRIVFCHSCSTPYHQLCHHPPIDRIVIEVADAQWFCSACQAKQQELPLRTGVSGQDLDPAVRKAYLTSLTKSQLVQLIQYAEKLHPSIPIYSPNTYELVTKIQQENAENPLRGKPASDANENLLVEVIRDKHPEGIEMSEIWPAVEAKRKIPSDAFFKHSASRALQRARRRGRVTLDGTRYFINPDYQPSSDETLSQLLEADDDVMFGYMPLRMVVGFEVPCVEESEVFSHKSYLVS